MRTKERICDTIKVNGLVQLLLDSTKGDFFLPVVKDHFIFSPFASQPVDTSCVVDGK